LKKAQIRPSGKEIIFSIDSDHGISRYGKKSKKSVAVVLDQ
jgi:hypothetical protein